MIGAGRGRLRRRRGEGGGCRGGTGGCTLCPTFPPGGGPHGWARRCGAGEELGGGAWVLPGIRAGAVRRVGCRLPGPGRFTRRVIFGPSGDRSFIAAVWMARPGCWCSGRILPCTRRSAAGSWSVRRASGCRACSAGSGSRPATSWSTPSCTACSARSGAPTHATDPAIGAYRNRWLNALRRPPQAGGGQQITAVITLGTLAKGAYRQWADAQPDAAAGLHWAAVRVVLRGVASCQVGHRSSVRSVTVPQRRPRRRLGPVRPRRR
jgi:hypothetical protein